jgi:hypothetical protein
LVVLLVCLPLLAHYADRHSQRGLYCHRPGRCPVRTLPKRASGRAPLMGRRIVKSTPRRNGTEPTYAFARLSGT